MTAISDQYCEAFVIEERALVEIIEAWLVREAFALQNMASDNERTRESRAKAHSASLMTKLNAARLPYDTSF